MGLACRGKILAPLMQTEAKSPFFDVVYLRMPSLLIYIAIVFCKLYYHYLWD